MICQQDCPLLVIVAPGSPGRNRRIELLEGRMVVGREPTCDIWLDDPRVSRTHAALQRRGNAVYVHDLGSSGGTFVGGTAVTTPRELRPGDVVSFASVLARFEPASTAAQETVFARPSGPAAQPAGYRPGSTRTRARWLSWTGVIVLAEGLAIAAMTKLSLPGQHGNTGLVRLGPSIAGIPSGQLGLALAAIGFLLLVAGIGQHIAASAAARSRRAPSAETRRSGVIPGQTGGLRARC